MRETVALVIVLAVTSPALTEVGMPWPQEQSVPGGTSHAQSVSAGETGTSAAPEHFDSGLRPSPLAPSNGTGSTDVAPTTSSPSSAAPASYPPAFGSRWVPGPDYVIGLGDALHISVWKEPEFSSTVQVRSDGKISIPLLNDLTAVGYKPMDLAALLTEKLRKYVDDPRVTVIVQSAGAPTFYLVGEVGHHGPMALTPNMTILQALVTAGLTTFANTKKIYVLRMENGVEKRIRVNYKAMVKGKQMNQNLLLQAGDMVVVP